MSLGDSPARQVAGRRAQGVRLTSFPPVVDAGTRVLILGSMPGARSLAEHEYYAHPRNLFWPLMDDLFGIERTWPYERRLAALLARGLGLWDVLRHCEREGSLDASIVTETEVPAAVDEPGQCGPKLGRETAAVGGARFFGQQLTTRSAANGFATGRRP